MGFLQVVIFWGLTKTLQIRCTAVFSQALIQRIWNVLVSATWSMPARFWTLYLHAHLLLRQHVLRAVQSPLSYTVNMREESKFTHI